MTATQSGIKIIQTVSPSPTNSQQLQVKRVAVAQGPAAHPAVRSTTTTKVPTSGHFSPLITVKGPSRSVTSNNTSHYDHI